MGYRWAAAEWARDLV